MVTTTKSEPEGSTVEDGGEGSWMWLSGSYQIGDKRFKQDSEESHSNPKESKGDEAGA